MRSHCLLASAALLLLGAVCVPAARSGPTSAPPRYLVHDLGLADSATLNDLNESRVGCGSIRVGGSEEEPLHHAAIFMEGRRIDLGTLGGSESIAYALNDQGQVVGASRTAAGPWHAFLWSDANSDGAANPGEMRDLGAAKGRASRAYDINNRGETVGEIITSIHNYQAFRWKAGKMSLLSVRKAGPTSANWIGDHGTILGVAAPGRDRIAHPARWRSGRVGEYIQPRASGYLGVAVVGRSSPGDIWLNVYGGILGPDPYVLRKGKKRITRLAHDGDHAAVASVNRFGQGVGGASLTTTDDEGIETYTTWGLYWHGVDAYELDELLQPESKFSILHANAINEAGWVAASAEDEEGETHLVLLEPQNAP